MLCQTQNPWPCRCQEGVSAQASNQSPSACAGSPCLPTGWCEARRSRSSLQEGLHLQRVRRQAQTRQSLAQITSLLKGLGLQPCKHLLVEAQSHLSSSLAGVAVL